jgi:hypothetical protein
MPSVVFETKIIIFERAKTIHALERDATVVGHFCVLPTQKYIRWNTCIAYFEMSERVTVVILLQNLNIAFYNKINIQCPVSITHLY